VADVSFMAGLPMQEALQALQVRAITLEGQLADVDTRMRAYAEYLPRLFLLEVEYARAMRQAELEWVRSIIADMQSGKLTWDGEADGSPCKMVVILDE
jgi:hypothetical protein